MQVSHLVPVRAWSHDQRRKFCVRRLAVVRGLHLARRTAGPASTASGFRATIDWGDGANSRGVVVRRGNGEYDVVSTKRYARRGTYKITVTLADNHYRVSIAQSRVLVRALR